MPTLLIFFFALLCLPPLLLGLAGRDGLAWDAISFHIPQINYFIAHPFALMSYEATATTLPFYHFMLAQCAGWLGLDHIDNASWAIRLVHFAISASGILAVLIYIAARNRRIDALILGVPLVTSWHILSGAIFFGTDGPGLSFSLLALLLLLTRRPTGLSHAAAFAAVAATRHMMLPYVIGASLWSALASHSVPRWVTTMAPAVLLLLPYIVLWGGLTPPGMVAALNPSGLFVHSLLGQLAVVGFWGIGYGLLRWRSWQAICISRSQIRHALLGAAIAITILWFAVPTGFAPKDGRFGSIAWSIAELFIVADHSVPILVMAIIGAASIILCAADCMEQGKAPLEMAGLAIFLCGLMLTYAAYQRYSEPLCIASFSIAFSRLQGQERFSPLAVWPLMLLSSAGLLRFWQAGLIQATLAGLP